MRMIVMWQPDDCKQLAVRGDVAMLSELFSSCSSENFDKDSLVCRNTTDTANRSCEATWPPVRCGSSCNLYFFEQIGCPRRR